jgi:hypothetical protein
MNGTEFDLPKLLWPVQPAVFFTSVWEKQVLAVDRKDAGYYSKLFTLADVDAVIAFTRPMFTTPDDFKPDVPAARNFIQGLLPDDESSSAMVYPDTAAVRGTFAKGKTVILTAMQCRWGPIAALCRRLEEHFGCHIHTNAYLTPAGAQGFDPHYDTHEVFVLQIEGSKHWRFYGPGRELPLAAERATFSRDQLGPPTQEAVVHPGDLLYMPRGHIHEAFTSDSLSLHLTVGIKVNRWVDLVHQAVDAVSARDVRLRASLPPGLLSGAGATAAPDAHFREILQAVVENACAGEAVERLATAFLGKLTSLPADSFSPVEVGGIGPDTVVERVPGAICREVALADGRVGLQFPGGSLEGPTKIAAALHFIACSPRFSVRSLPEGLTQDGKLVLVRRLVRDRFLRVVSVP